MIGVVSSFVSGEFRCILNILSWYCGVSTKNSCVTLEKHTAMERELEKSLIIFFSYVEKLNIRWQEALQAVARPLESLENQSEQFRQVTSPDVGNAEICKFKNARDKLVFKINMGIEDELSAIFDSLQILNRLYQELNNKLHHVNTLRSKITDEIDVGALSKGSTLKPRLNSLLEWTILIHNHYRQHLNAINESFKAFNKANKLTIEKMSTAFAVDRTMHEKISKILAFTQFLSRENVR